MHPDKEENARKLVQMMKEIGFAYIDNVPGFDKEIEKDLLQANKWFFALPMKKKMEVSRRMYNKTSKQVYRGYFGLDRNYSSYKEGFEFGQDESTWPDYVEDPEEMKEGFPLTERNIWPQPDPDDSPEEQKHYNDFKRIMGSHFK
jgi:isopenicillin N synthase-like dioxygenase